MQGNAFPQDVIIKEILELYKRKIVEVSEAFCGHASCAYPCPRVVSALTKAIDDTFKYN